MTHVLRNIGFLVMKLQKLRLCWVGSLLFWLKFSLEVSEFSSLSKIHLVSVGCPIWECCKTLNTKVDSQTILICLDWRKNQEWETSIELASLFVVLYRWVTNLGSCHQLIKLWVGQELDLLSSCSISIVQLERCSCHSAVQSLV